MLVLFVNYNKLFFYGLEMLWKCNIKILQKPFLIIVSSQFPIKAYILKNNKAILWNNISVQNLISLCLKVHLDCFVWDKISFKIYLRHKTNKTYFVIVWMLVAFPQAPTTKLPHSIAASNFSVQGNECNPWLSFFHSFTSFLFKGSL